MGEEASVRKGLRIPREESPQNQLRMAHRGPHGSSLGLLCIHGSLRWGFLVVLTMLQSDSFVCLWDPFPPTGLPHPALIWGFVPSLTASCYAEFNWYLWEACSLLKGNGGGVDFGERRCGEHWDNKSKGRLRSQCIAWEKNKYKFKKKNW